MSAYVNYPLTASDDDEFFDAPSGSLLLNADGEVTHGKVGDGWDWRSSEEFIVQSGDLWASLFPGNQYEVDITPGYVLRVPLEWARAYGLAASREAAEAAAEARVAAWMAGAK
ncbi:MAG TPA: hypothetical protein VIT65_10725 [Microlunatus sp.]